MLVMPSLTVIMAVQCRGGAPSSILHHTAALHNLLILPSQGTLQGCFVFVTISRRAVVLFCSVQALLKQLWSSRCARLVNRPATGRRCDRVSFLRRSRSSHFVDTQSIMQWLCSIYSLLV